MRYLGYFLFLFFMPFIVNGQVFISEIMYDLEGSDSGREWVEIFNSGGESLDIDGWKFYENGTNHNISLAEEEGNFIIEAGSHAILSDNPGKFMADYPSFEGVVFDSSFSLSNSGENLILKDSELNEIDSIFYNTEIGAAGDGNSLQKNDNEWLVATPTPGAENASEGEEEDSEPEEDTSPTTESSGFDWGGYTPPEDLPKLKVYAGEDKTLAVGASSLFSGTAAGYKDQPLENARYLWNLGDGTLREGKEIRHFYKYPGVYMAVLEVSSGNSYSSNDFLNVKVIPNEIIISEVKTGADSFIEIKNGSKEDINLEDWKIVSGGQEFIFPKNSFIKAGGYLVLPVSSSGIVFEKNSRINSRINLLYSNGVLADSFICQGVLEEGQSFSFYDGEVVISPESPGLKNLKPPAPIAIKINPTPIIEPPVAKIQTQAKGTEPEIISGENKEADAKSDIQETEQENLAQNQQANIMVIGGKKEENSSNIYYYILGIIGLAFFAGLAVFVLRRR